MILRAVEIGWGWEVYVEMFVAGIAAGAYLIAMILELMGRGRSPLARTAHVIALPLVIVATVLLVMKLERPERFWHMVIQNNNIPWPMFKWWAPISLGTWGLIAFTGFTGLSFVDAIVDRGWFQFGPWRHGQTLHDSILGKLWALGGAPTALFVAAYSGALLSVTALRGWTDSVFLSALFVAISGTTGAALLLLIDAFRKKAATDELAGLVRFSLLLLIWQLVLLMVVAISLGGAITFFFSSFRTIAAAALGIMLALAAPMLLYFRPLRPLRADGLRLGVGGSLVLVSGFLLRYWIVMGPQHAVE
jgi:formate-dependent nitrite reductase membrane component NrfD